MPRVLLDTRAWRELIDADAVELLRKTAKRTTSHVLVAPGVVYEMLRTPDSDLRRRQIQAVTRQSWTRLMPEIFTECNDVRAVIGARRPEGCLPSRTSPRFIDFERTGLAAAASGGAPAEILIAKQGSLRLWAMIGSSKRVATLRSVANTCLTFNTTVFHCTAGRHGHHVESQVGKAPRSMRGAWRQPQDGGPAL